jgi:hypothetical protein
MLHKIPPKAFMFTSLVDVPHNDLSSHLAELYQLQTSGRECVYAAQKKVAALCLYNWAVLRVAALSERPPAAILREEMADALGVDPSIIDRWQMKGEMPNYLRPMVSKLAGPSDDMHLTPAELSIAATAGAIGAATSMMDNASCKLRLAAKGKSVLEQVVIREACVPWIDDFLILNTIFNSSRRERWIDVSRAHNGRIAELLKQPGFVALLLETWHALVDFGWLMEPPTSIICRTWRRVVLRSSIVGPLRTFSPN